jgi:xylose isomerase
VVWRRHVRAKADAAFDLFGVLNVPFFCFYDADVRPEGDSFAESRRNLEEICDIFADKMQQTGTRLLWSTANMFSHRRWIAGAATKKRGQAEHRTGSCHSGRSQLRTRLALAGSLGLLSSIDMNRHDYQSG